MNVFLGRAQECGILGDGLETTDCRIWFADQCGYMRSRRLREAPDCELKGNYQDHNLQTAYVALQVLRRPTPPQGKGAFFNQQRGHPRGLCPCVYPHRSARQMGDAQRETARHMRHRS